VEFVLSEAKDRIAAITLNRPDARNAAEQTEARRARRLLDEGGAGRRRGRDRAEGERPALLVGARHLREAGRAHDLKNKGLEAIAAFDVHTTGHGNALSVTGWPVIMDLEGMKKAQRGS
jgi:enoyl-CoA hydratase/carnithine racemase